MSRIGLVGSRARVEQDWALLPPEGVAGSVLPEWRKHRLEGAHRARHGRRVRAVRLALAAGGGTQQTLADGVQSFLFVFEGGAPRPERRQPRARRAAASRT